VQPGSVVVKVNAPKEWPVDNVVV